MTETEDKSRRTEKATPKKLRDARKRGQVIRSKEAVSTVSILSVFAFVYITWETQLERLKGLILVPANVHDTSFTGVLSEVFESVGARALEILGPLVLLVVAVVVIANIGQFGLVFSTDPLKPKLSKLNPAEGFKRIYSQRALIELLKSAIKVVLVTLTAVFVVRSFLDALVRVPSCNIDCALTLTASMLKTVAAAWAAIFVTFSIIDYFVEKAQFLKEQRMTREEVKRERKDMEGDPHIRALRKRFHREVATSSGAGATNASVLVSGPDMAVALFYEAGNTPLPEIVAIGRNLASERIRALARDNKVPIVRNPELAAVLLQKGQVGQYIPHEVIDETAAVLRRLKSGLA